MARKPKSVYQKIEELQSQILSTEEKLQQYKNELTVCMKEKDELEMQQAWELIKEKGLTLNDLETVLNKK